MRWQSRKRAYRYALGRDVGFFDGGRMRVIPGHFAYSEIATYWRFYGSSKHSSSWIFGSKDGSSSCSDLWSCSFAEDQGM